MAAKNKPPNGTVIKEASPIRQSKIKINRILHSGAVMWDGSSGIKWAIESSSFATLSTIKFLKLPEGVSNMTPMGTFAILSAIFSRIFCKIVKEIRWDRSDDLHIRNVLMHWQSAAIPANITVSLVVAVPK